MDLSTTLSSLTPYDLAALAFLAVVWLVVSWRIEHPGAARPSVTVMMAEYRRRWMEVFLTRSVRIFDSQILGTLRQGTSFFASTSLLAIGGVLALIGNPAPLADVAAGITAEAEPVLLWQLRMVPVLILVSHAFLKFVWAHRLFGYCSVLMASVPEGGEGEEAARRSRMAAEMNIRAAMNFNRGLRSLYFAIGAVAWLVGPVPLIVATIVVAWVLWSREFQSTPHRILMEQDA